MELSSVGVMMMQVYPRTVQMQRCERDPCSTPRPKENDVQGIVKLPRMLIQIGHSGKGIQYAILCNSISVAFWMLLPPCYMRFLLRKAVNSPLDCTVG